MRQLVLALSLMFCCQSAFADFIFSVAQRTPGDIVIGSKAIFDVSIATSTTLGTVNNVGGVTFHLGADEDVQDFKGTVETAGQWSNATIDPASPLAGGRNYGFANEGFAAPNGSFAVLSVSSSTNRQLTPGGFLLGSFELDTSGPRVTLGPHRILFNPRELDVIDSGGNRLNVNGVQFIGNPLSITIVAVPEPSSLLLVGTSFAAMALRRRRK